MLAGKLEPGLTRSGHGASASFSKISKQLRATTTHMLSLRLRTDLGCVDQLPRRPGVSLMVNWQCFGPAHKQCWASGPGVRTFAFAPSRNCMHKRIKVSCSPLPGLLRRTNIPFTTFITVKRASFHLNSPVGSLLHPFKRILFDLTYLFSRHLQHGFSGSV